LRVGFVPTWPLAIGENTPTWPLGKLGVKGWG